MFRPGFLRLAAGNSGSYPLYPAETIPPAAQAWGAKKMHLSIGVVLGVYFCLKNSPAKSLNSVKNYRPHHRTAKSA